MTVIFYGLARFNFRPYDYFIQKKVEEGMSFGGAHSSKVTTICWDMRKKAFVLLQLVETSYTLKALLLMKPTRGLLLFLMTLLS